MLKDDSRRKKPRFIINLDCYYYLNEWKKCRIFDLNLEGAGLSSVNSFEINEIIKVKIKNKKEEIIVDTIIINARKSRIGIKFIDLETSEIKFLKKIINTFSDRYKI